MGLFFVGPFEFQKWRRDEPSLPGEQLANFTKPGTDGTGQQKLGAWAEQIEAELVAWIGGGREAERAGQSCTDVLPAATAVVGAIHSVVAALIQAIGPLRMQDEIVHTLSDFLFPTTREVVGFHAAIPRRPSAAAINGLERASGRDRHIDV